MDKDGLLTNLKNTLSLNYLVKNHQTHQHKTGYLVAISIVDLHAFLAVLFLNIFLVKEAVEINTLDGLTSVTSAELSQFIIWILLGLVLVLHLLLSLYQFRQKILMNGLINIPLMLGVLLTFSFKTKVNVIASLFILVSGVGYLGVYLYLRKKLVR